jgi:glucose-1-phosphate adenylyltransferase
MLTQSNEQIKDCSACHARVDRQLLRKTLAIVLAGGEGNRMGALTRWRAKPAVPFGGKFRIIDFPLSNCVNSGIKRICVLTQYKAHSLIHNFMRDEIGEFIEIVPAQMRVEKSWYSGTADAVFQNLDIIRNHRPEYVLILGGDHVYKMDYGPLVTDHVDRGADVSVVCLEVPSNEAYRFGVMAVDSNMRVTGFVEKPEHPPEIPGKPGLSLVSMGIYVFNQPFLREKLLEDASLSDTSHDFGKDILPRIFPEHQVYAYPFTNPEGVQSFWRDVGTIDSYWDANMDLVRAKPQLNLYDSNWPIWSYQPQLPPAKFVFNEESRRGMAVDSLVSGGCIISGAMVNHSLLFSGVRIEERSVVTNSVILTNVQIGRGCEIHNAIIDKNTVIPDGTRIGVDEEEDRKRFTVTDEKRIVLVTPDALGQHFHDPAADDS